MGPTAQDRRLDGRLGGGRLPSRALFRLASDKGCWFWLVEQRPPRALIGPFEYRNDGEWKPHQAYFTTGRANDGGTEAVNGLIELAPGVARGFRNSHNWRLRMLLIGGGLRL